MKIKHLHISKVDKYGNFTLSEVYEDGSKLAIYTGPNPFLHIMVGLRNGPRTVVREGCIDQP